MTTKITSTAIDFIGDIHGHADQLEELLRGALGYERTNGFFKHQKRKAFFVGDFIDRGPQIKDVLDIVKPMIDNGAAYTIIGNHEYNAICYWTKGSDGSYLREHNDKHEGQHKKTIDAIDPDLLVKYVEWFKSFPIYVEHEQFKVIHAQWKQEYVNHLKKININNFNNAEFLHKSAKQGTEEFKMIDCLLKGEEVSVPGVPFKDKDNNERFAYRMKWWLMGTNLSPEESLFEFPKGVKAKGPSISSSGYPKDLMPIFFGHYWLKDSEPSLRQSNVCCLDFSVAKGGILAAYRWDGELQLSQEKFEWV